MGWRLLPGRPASQKGGQSDNGDGDHDRRNSQRQPHGYVARLVNSRAFVSVRVLVSVHVPAFLLARVQVAHPLDALPAAVLTCLRAQCG